MFINSRPFLHTPHEDTRRYQKEILDVLADIDAVSNKYEIDYNLEAGSALGAARHKGFIPWDNDSDIFMPVVQVKEFLIALARESLFEEYDIWYTHSDWDWMIKDIYIPGILKDPDNYCEASFDWAISQITYAMFRLVRKETMTINMSLSKKVNTYQVAHFDTVLSTISLRYQKMLPEERRTWRRRYLLKTEDYRVHPFVDIFPYIEMSPASYINMKRGFRVRDNLNKLKRVIARPTVHIPRVLSSYLPSNHLEFSKRFNNGKQFQDYRAGDVIDYKRGIEKAKLLEKNGDKVLVSIAPWNIRKIIPYAKSEIFPLKRTKFESLELFVPNDLIGVLTNHYKEFQTLPPEEERIQHAYHCDPTQFEQIIAINE